MFSPKSHSVINIIAWVSLIAVAVPTAAVIILLAMFEGLTGVINELDTTLDGDIEIVAQRGQTFDEDALDLALLGDIDGVESITFSNSELVSVSKVEEDTTVGAIKERLGLECEYSAELTE
jgi:ABC-type lipoprotein release transport system permease subunit